jgi:hypothetical protein
MSSRSLSRGSSSIETLLTFVDAAEFPLRNAGREGRFEEEEAGNETLRRGGCKTPEGEAACVLLVAAVLAVAVL